ncbi:toll/interleukin-1 receptor domain-containing protein [Pseudotabrizicola sp. 4114]|uniref:toll/interleukin-1 receptor domain-containing protein n=1 Tax=Pseudotabrizicola sp. 4114 TaxID=2817731 RepID=UPI00285D0E0E|nr:hypothetical protein [Pseudorhodobacter sp. 4114]
MSFADGTRMSGFSGDRNYDFFLSYSRDDAPLVLSVVKELSGSGIDIFIDEIEIGWGDSINEKIFSSLEKTRNIVVFLTDSAIQSKWVRKELSTALTNEISRGSVIILPVLLADQASFFEAFPFMRDKKYIKFEGPEHLAAEMKKLIRGQASTSFVFNHPRTYSGPVWIRLFATDKDNDHSHKVTITWGPWYRGTSVVLSASQPSFLLHSKGDDDESLPIRVYTDRPAYVAFGQGIPSDGRQIDLNPFWVDAKSRLKRLYASIFLWPSDRNR